jgi:thioredoxin reductase (NADPH)
LQRRNTRSLSFSPNPLGDSNNGSNCRNGRKDTILPLNHHHHHHNHHHDSVSNSMDTWGRLVTRRKKKSNSSEFPNYGGSATGTGSIIFVIVLLIFAVREWNLFHHRIRKSHRHSSQWSWFPFGTFSLASSSRSVSPVQLLPEMDHSDMVLYDVVIAGAGAAGLSAALFAARAGLKVLVLGSSQGLLSQTKQLDNFPSFLGNGNADPATGSAWLEATKAQAEEFGAEFALPGLLASSIHRTRLERKDRNNHSLTNDDDDNDIFFTVSTVLHEYYAWSVIVASGAKPRTLNLPKEEDLWGVTLHNCAICDGHLYTGKDQHVLVVGGGDAALDAAILLARYAGQVTLVHRRTEFTSANNAANWQVVNSTPNIVILTPFVVEEWHSDTTDKSKLIGATLRDPNSASTRQIQIHGAFVMIGADPNTHWIQDIGVDLDDEGLIRLPHLESSRRRGIGETITTASTLTTQTSIPGIFAAGEVVDRIYKQAITAAASGAQASIDAERWLRERHGVVLYNPSSSSSSSSSRKRKATRDTIRSVEVVKKESDKTVPQEREAAETTVLMDVDKGGKDCDLTEPDCIQSIVHQYPVVVFSKQWCPYCRKALEALSLAGIKEPHVIDLSQYSNTQDIQSTLQQLTGRRTVPNVFVGGTSIGGGDETVRLQQSGKLIPILKSAGALAATIVKANSGNGEPHTFTGQDGTETCDLASEDCFQEIVEKCPVVMFSLSWCPECKRSLELLSRLGVKPHIVDLDDYKPIAQDIRLYMLNRTGRRSVPNLFVGGEYIGGFARTTELYERGALVPLFQKVGVL